MAKKSKLLLALDAHKGCDYEAEKRKKELKAGEKRKRQKEEAKKRPSGLNSDEEISAVQGEKQQPAHLEADTEQDFASFPPDTAQHATNGTKIHLDTPKGILKAPRSKIKDTAQLRDGPEPEEEDEEEEEEEEDESDVPFSEVSAEDREDAIPHQRLRINNGAALLASTKRVGVVEPNMTFQSHNSLVSELPPTSESVPDPDDDLTRELEFYRIARDGATTARSLLLKANIPFTRPNDYFAEMVKSDEHMGRVKKKMYDDAANKKASSEAKAQREARKFGKAVQQAKEEERARGRKDTLEKIKDLKRKRKGQDTGLTNEPDNLFQSIDVENAPKKDKFGRERGGGGPATGSSTKRQKHDSKFGFGGKKRFAKSADAVSTADISGFSAGRMKGRNGARPGPGKKTTTTKRLGKSRRATGGR